MNTIYSVFGVAYRRFYYLPKQMDLTRRAFKDFEKREGHLPSLLDMERNVSAVLVNSHPVISFKRPKMPGLIDCAGLHISPIKPLPSDIQEFLDGATDGAIYFSFGTYMRSSEMPKDKLNAILKVFTKTKMRVVWKFEADGVKFPPNVMVRKFLPQSDILAHRNVKLFITHGGIYGLQEAIFHAVPVVIFPFYGDQVRFFLRIGLLPLLQFHGFYIFP
jgi:glucuronosyltransferase